MNPIPSVLSPATVTRLEKHIEQKRENLKWLLPCLNGQSNAFPYTLSEEGHGEVVQNSLCYPKAQSTQHPTDSSAAVRFVINIPEGSSPLTPCSSVHYTQMIKQVANESFGITPALSNARVKERVAIVIGTNQVESLDPACNRDFKAGIENTPACTEIASRRLGFLWRPRYVRSDATLKAESPQKSFFLLKMISAKSAQEVRSAVEEQNGRLHPLIIAQIPFQNIRETILKNDLTRQFADHFHTIAPASPVYLTVMDKDFLSLHNLFTKVTAATSIQQPLSVIGCAYSAAATELPLIRLCVKIDGAIRVAMSQIIPYSAYLPEPFLCALAKRPHQPPHLDGLSFARNGQALESRRLIENGKKSGVFDDRMTFLADGPVTTSPERWKTKKNSSYVTLSAKDIQSKQVLQALRGLSQSHAHPKKWADQVYAAIPFSCSHVTDATTPMMEIFHVYDPISRMIDCEGRFLPAKTFNKEMANYHSPLTQQQTNRLIGAKQALRDLKMPALLIDQIEAAAKASGQAIYTELCIATQ